MENGEQKIKAAGGSLFLSELWF